MKRMLIFKLGKLGRALRAVKILLYAIYLSKHKSERTVALASEILSLPKFTGYALMTGGYPVAKIDFEKLKYQEPLFKNVNFEAKKIIEKIEGSEIQDNDDIKIEE